ncbi:MAG: aldolase/citrate lyase family protein, partial [Porcipelethomonas sp.]
MNRYETKMYDLLKELRDDYNVLAIKSEFEAEGSREDELVKLNEIVFRADMDIYIKIGGCEAVRDIEKCRILGAKGIMAPMIETPFAMKKFLNSINRVYTEDECKDMFFIFNAETITGYNNLDQILSVEGIERIHSISVGRVDFTASLGYDRSKINSDEITGYVRNMLVKAREKNIMAGMGGGVSTESIPVIEELGDVIEKFETRKVVFRYDDSLNIYKGLEKAMEFEIL